VSITLGAGESATCTFTNTQQGSITIKKETDPDGGAGFDFTGTGFPASCDLDAFTLDDDEQESCDNLAPGTYVITESALAGWDLTDISCSGDATVKFGDGTSFHDSFTLGDDSVEITLGAGESATCTFSNEEEEVPVQAIINLTKTATDGAGHEITEVYVGDTIVYVFEVENPGVPSLISVTLTDDMGICDAGPVRGADKVGNNDNTLEPGEIWVYTCSHVVTAGDPDPLVNHATASGTPTVAATLTPAEDDATVRILTGLVPVGGTVAPVNKAALLAPWIALFVAIVAAAETMLRRRRAQG